MPAAPDRDELRRLHFVNALFAHLTGHDLYLAEQIRSAIAFSLGELEAQMREHPEYAARYDAAFTANTLHIMPWPAVEALFAGLPGVLADGAKLVIYGPFNYGGRHTSDSNAAFDRSLKEKAPHQGLRDFEQVAALAARAGLELIDDRAMPSNNRCLVWRRRSGSIPGDVIKLPGS